MVLVYDCVLGRPACPILQAVLGGDQGIAGRFPAESWLVEPTPEMKAYLVDEGQLSELVRMNNASPGD